MERRPLADEAQVRTRAPRSLDPADVIDLRARSLRCPSARTALARALRAPRRETRLELARVHVALPEAAE